jgi:DNA helicase HerA-like ATPase
VSNTRNLTEAGIVVGEASSNEFYFASKNEEYPPKWEYLVVYSRELIGGKLEEVPVVAQVERIASVSEALTKSTDMEALKKIIQAEIADVRTWGQARILGFLSEKDGKILQARRAINPGKLVFIAPNDILEKFYSFPEDEGLYIGQLITRADVPVYLSLKGFRRHLAIIAQTGAGKSYSAGVLIEELISKGATIIVIDPHADYVYMSLKEDGGRHSLSDKVTVFRNPSSTSRAVKDVGKVLNYEVSFSELSDNDICDIAGINPDWGNIREAVRLAKESLGDNLNAPQDLLNAVENPDWAVKEDAQGREVPDRQLRGAARSASKYIRNLVNLRVFGTTSTGIAPFLKPSHLSIVDLSGLDDRAMNYIAASILEEAYAAAEGEKYEFPIFVILEEAHKFIPPKYPTYASPIVNKIAAEGRKFGVFLCLITQRPSKVNPDSLSQCNSQLIMKLTNPEDQKAVEASSERLSEDLLDDLPGLNPGECVVVGEVTRAPVMVKVRPRVTREGGADIDVVRKLKEARKAAGVDEAISAMKSKREPFEGGFD